MWYKDWFSRTLQCPQGIVDAQQEMDTGFDRQHLCGSSMADIHLALCLLLPQLFARKRAHRKKRAKRHAQALVLKACAIACRDYSVIAVAAGGPGPNGSIARAR